MLTSPVRWIVARARMCVGYVCMCVRVFMCACLDPPLLHIPNRLSLHSHRQVGGWLSSEQGKPTVIQRTVEYLNHANIILRESFLLVAFCVFFVSQVVQMNYTFHSGFEEQLCLWP